MNKVNRREFLKKISSATITGGAVALSGCTYQRDEQSNAPALKNKKKYKWKMTTTWPPRLPILAEGAKLFAKWIDEMSAGRLKIRVYSGGELVTPLGSFDAVQQGTVEMGHGAAYYWAGKLPSAQFFASVPFGMNPQQMNSWLYSGGGLELWQEIYDTFNLIPFPCGNTGIQMGGWFNRKINTMEDFRGLKMRIPGLGGKILKKAGGSAILSPGGEIYTNLERGVIDATEWIGPYHDMLMGFHKIAKYYYYPGWHEPGAVLELIINKKAYNSLPADLQMIIQTAAYRSNLWILAEFEAKNSLYLQKLRKESKIQILKFPDNVLSTFKKYTQESIQDLISQDPLSKKVYQSFSQFQQAIGAWSGLTEKIYYANII